MTNFYKYREGPVVIVSKDGTASMMDSPVVDKHTAALDPEIQTLAHDIELETMMENTGKDNIQKKGYHEEDEDVL